jgi:hypothetical protein
MGILLSEERGGGYSLERPLHNSLLPFVATRRTVDEGGAMAKFTKQTRKTLGQPPGTLVHIGQVYGQGTVLARIEYDTDRVIDSHPSPSQAVVPEMEGSTLWLDVDGVHDASTIEEIGASAGLHPLILEDVMHTGERPKLEESAAFLFVSQRMLRVARMSRSVSFLAPRGPFRSRSVRGTSLTPSARGFARGEGASAAREPITSSAPSSMPSSTTTSLSWRTSGIASRTCTRE